MTYNSDDIVLIENGEQAYAQYRNCWAVVKKVYSQSAEIAIMGQVLQVPRNALKKLDLIDESLRQVARRIVALLERNDLDEMEREILQSYHKRFWLTDWQLQLLSAIERMHGNGNAI